MCLLVFNSRLSPTRKTKTDVPETDGAKTDAPETDGSPRRRSPRREVRLFLFVCFIERLWKALVDVTVSFALSIVFMQCSMSSRGMYA